MFSEDPLEQDLYHAIATVASLLRISEVGKFFSPSVKKPTGGTLSKDQGSSTEDESPLPAREPPQGPVQELQPPAMGHPQSPAREPPQNPVQECQPRGTLSHLQGNPIRPQYRNAS